MIFNSIGYDFCHDKNFNIVRPQGLDEYLLLIIRSKAYFGPENDRLKIGPNSLIVFHKNTPQYFGADRDLYVNDWISFDLNTEEEKFFKQTVVFDKIVQSEAIDVLSQIVMLMQKEWYSSSTYKEEILNLYFKIIQEKLGEIFSSSGQNKIYYKNLLSIRMTIYNKPWIKYSVKDLASELNISESYFHHLYKKYFEISPIADAINSRVEYSKQLLSSSNYSVREISEMLNYKNDTQFMKQFKLITNMTPSEYRKNPRVVK